MITQQEYEEMRAWAFRNRAEAAMEYERHHFGATRTTAAPHISVRSGLRPGAPKKQRQWNKTEEAFSRILDARLRANEIRQWWFESMTFKLGRDCRYTPDFNVIHADGSLHLYEIKGAYVRDDARVKFRVAATVYPCFGWWWGQWKDGRWTIEPEQVSLHSVQPRSMCSTLLTGEKSETQTT